MTETAEQERRKGERRHAVERRLPKGRRSSLNRRTHERRSLQLKIARRDRRRALNRRIAERRQHSERRTPEQRRRLRSKRAIQAPFTAKQLADLRRVFNLPKSPLTCPGCGGAFTIGRGRRRGAETLRRIQCLRCGRSAVIPGDMRMRVLVIAGKEIVRNSIRAVLAEVGHEVIDAADASIGLFAYQQSPADVVFIDVLVAGRMPAGEFIRQIRKFSPDARIVAVSGRSSFGGPDPLMVARELGASQTIRAPFSQSQLLEAVRGK